METWKRLERFDGNYSISDLGRLINNDTGRILKGSKGGRGYIQFHGTINGKSKNITIHQLVWEVFNGTPLKGIHIDHINNIKTDNRLINLQLLTCRDNHHKSAKVGKSGVHGVSWDSTKNRWKAGINLNDVRYTLGYRKDIDDAKLLYDNALSNYNINGTTPR